MVETYEVRVFSYVIGPFDDPVSNLRWTVTTKPEVVATTNNLGAALRIAASYEKDNTKAYVTRKSDGKEYAGGVWV